MKNSIALLIILIIGITVCPAQSQTRTTSVRAGDATREIADTAIAGEKDTDTVKIGSVIITQCRDCDNGDKTSVQFNSDHKKKSLKNVELSWLGFDLGLNSYIDKSDYGSDKVNDFVRLGEGKPEATEELFSLRTIKSVNVNIWPILIKVNLIQHVLNLKTGIGVEMNNYRYSKNISYVNTPQETYITLSDIDLNKNKLFTEYLTIPLLLNLNTNPYHDSRAFHFSAGPTFGLLIKSHTKQKSDERGKVKDKKPFNLEDFRTGMRVEVGYGPINFYGAYSLTPIHKYGLKQYPFSIGISLAM